MTILHCARWTRRCEWRAEKARERLHGVIISSGGARRRIVAKALDATFEPKNVIEFETIKKMKLREPPSAFDGK